MGKLGHPPDLDGDLGCGWKGEVSASWRIKGLGGCLSADSYNAGSGSDFIHYLDQSGSCFSRQAQRGDVAHLRTHSFLV